MSRQCTPSVLRVLLELKYQTIFKFSREPSAENYRRGLRMQDTHVRRTLDEFGENSVIMVSRSTADRLIVFIHGFNGSAARTWRQFDTPNDRKWWSSADLLFIAYNSLQDNINSVAARIEAVFKEVFGENKPHLPDSLRMVYGNPIRADSEPYEKTILVGHSAGGVVVRSLVVRLGVKALSSHENKSELLNWRMVLFSPATAGFLPSKWLSLALKLKIGRFAALRFRLAPIYSELSPDSKVLETIKAQTERLYEKFDGELQIFQPTILWASPDNVVQVSQYMTDLPGAIADGRSHSDVCKPDEDYCVPWEVVEKET